ncbi:DUF1877 family protein [Kitasatospora sp. NPDC056783]|uniref:DUF1877 family protein n=1 Tax=Kitasatospora sp. NPDC056783 TaxID=3345943 RepID=UPI0036A37D92
MSVDFFWRRVDGRLLDELTPEELAASVPHWSDNEFRPLREAGTLMAVERNGCLMHFALMGADAPSFRVARLPVYAGERRTGGKEVSEYGFIVGTEVVVLRSEEVRDASDFLRQVAVEDLVRDLESDLAEEVESLGFAKPWSREWADELAADLGELKRFFAAAAAAGDAMVKFESG